MTPTFFNTKFGKIQVRIQKSLKTTKLKANIKLIPSQQTQNLLKKHKKLLKTSPNDIAIIVQTNSLTPNTLIQNFLQKHKTFFEKRAARLLNTYLQHKQNVNYMLVFGETMNIQKVCKFLNLQRKNSCKNTFTTIKKLYKKIAKDYITQQTQQIVQEYNKKYNISYQNIRITSATTRWGSCSRKKNLNFSYRLIMHPKPVTDYVIKHELAHTVHQNHSKDFWNLVQNLDPEYKKHEKLLHNPKKWIEYIK